MSYRVTAAEVQEIINYDESAFPTITAFIKAANLVVTDKLGSSTVLSSDQLMEIERWLAAHFIAVADQRLKSEKIGQAQNEYQGDIASDAIGLHTTFYGKQALVLDVTGTLASLGKKKAKLTTIDIDW